VILALWSSAAPAAPLVPDPVPLPPKSSPSRHHLLYHDIIVGSMVGVYLLSETTLRPQLAPLACRWCEVPGIDSSVRHALVWGDRDQANTISNYTGIVLPSLVPVGMVFFSGWSDISLADGIDGGLAIVEAALASGLVTQTIKFSIGRQRPYAHYANPPLTPAIDSNDSFFSGHTSYSFSIAVASGTVASARHYELAPAVWAVGLTLAATTGYLRIASDSHYLSDVVVGAAVGSSIGYFMPRWLHDHGRIGTRVVPAPGGIALIGTF